MVELAAELLTYEASDFSWELQQSQLVVVAVRPSALLVVSWMLAFIYLFIIKLVPRYTKKKKEKNTGKKEIQKNTSRKTH